MILWVNKHYLKNHAGSGLLSFSSCKSNLWREAGEREVGVSGCLSSNPTSATFQLCFRQANPPELQCLHLQKGYDRIYFIDLRRG